MQIPKSSDHNLFDQFHDSHISKVELAEGLPWLGVSKLAVFLQYFLFDGTQRGVQA
jgi:hypothetical protein